MKAVKSFIDQVVTNATDSKGRNARIANLVQAQDAAHIANRIALTFVELNVERKTRRVEAVRSGQQQKDMLEKPEHLLSFVQSMMNNSCWAARKVINSGLQVDLANGLDFSQDVAAQAANLESSAVSEVESTLMEDFSVLNELHSWLCSEMNYMTDLDPLFLYAEKQEVEPEQWELVHMCMDLPHVLSVLEDKVAELAEESEGKVVQFAATHEFGKKKAA